jgi:hypothetical protein
MICLEPIISDEAIEVKKTIEERLEEILNNINDSSKREKTINDIDSLKDYISNHLNYNREAQIKVAEKGDERRLFAIMFKKYNMVDYDNDRDEAVIQPETPEDFKENRILFKLIIINFLDSLKVSLKSKKFNLDSRKNKQIIPTLISLIAILNIDNELINSTNKPLVNRISNKLHEYLKAIKITPTISYSCTPEGEIVQADSDSLFDYLHDYFTDK